MPMTEQGRKTRNRLFIFLVLIGGFFGLRTMAARGIGKSFMPAFMVPKSDLAGVLDNNVNMSGSAKEFFGLPSAVPATDLPGPTVRIHWWAWNSQMGCHFANGGPITTKNSLMAKHGVRVQIDRQDDNNVLATELTAFANDLHSGNAEPTKGIHFTGIMGDGSGAFLTPLNRELVKAFGEDYRAEIIGSCGYSRGEDKLMGPERWKTDPQTLKGSVIAGVVRDGDWNIAMRYAGDNNVPNNPDETTYDPNAINWVNTSSFTDAAEKYVTGYSEKRKVVNNGKPTGRDTTITVQGAVTWTPGDVTMAMKKGGVVTVVSTKEYANQMPHVIIGIHKWNQAHRALVENMLAAFAEGGDQVLTFPKALDKAADISQEIYKEQGQTGEYWKKYYLGARERDKTNQMVDLGGSKANNLADELRLFGLSEGSSPQTSIFHATYTSFGTLSATMYPKLMPALLPADEVFDPSYLRDVAEKAGSTGIGKAETITYSNTDTVSKVVGKRDVTIEFATGSSTPTSAGERQLAKLADELTINTLRIVVHGHTDNVGSAAANDQLSEDRAAAVKKWLETRAPDIFPSGRISIRAHGSSEPVCQPESTTACRAKNRRVQIVIGQ